MAAKIVEEITCASAEELVQRLAPVDELWRRTGGQSSWLFRGQKLSWPLTPKALRPKPKPFWHFGIGAAGPMPEPQGLDELMRLEHDAVVRFVERCIRLGLPLPEDGQLIRSDFASKMAPEHTELLEQGVDFPHPLLRSLYALGQHYGVPTRLLDWSRSPWVGAYFACHEVAKSRSEQKEWDRQTQHAEDGLGDPPIGPRPEFSPDAELEVWGLRRLVFEDAAERGESLGMDVVEVTAPYETNPNLRAQEGVFTLVRFKRVPSLAEVRDTTVRTVVDAVTAARYGSALRRGDYGNGPYMVCLRLPHAEAGKLPRLLSDYRASHGALFPGYAGAVRDIEERAHWE